MDNSSSGDRWGDDLPTLPGRRILLRWLRDSDVPALLEIFGDPTVMRYWDSLPLKSINDAADLLREIRMGFAERRLFQWGIAELGSDEVIGTCTLFHHVEKHRRAEIGFALARKCWGKGFASDALNVLLDFAFGSLDLHRLEADVDPRNERSINLLERHGFKREGTLRERYFVHDGEIQNSAFFGLLRSEW